MSIFTCITGSPGTKPDKANMFSSAPETERYSETVLQLKARPLFICVKLAVNVWKISWQKLAAFTGSGASKRWQQCKMYHNCQTFHRRGKLSTVSKGFLQVHHVQWRAAKHLKWGETNEQTKFCADKHFCCLLIHGILTDDWTLSQSSLAKCRKCMTYETTSK